MLESATDVFRISKLDSTPNLNDQILSLSSLRCKVCKEIPSSPVMSYENGNLCGSCYNKDDHSVALRNTTLEEILNELKFSCSYEKNGCKDTLTYKELMLHKTECIHRNFNCPIKMYEDCNWKGTITKLKEHLLSDHSNLLIKENIADSFVAVPVNIVKSNGCFSFFLIDEKLFLLHVVCNVEAQKVWYVVYYVGMDENVLINYYTIEIFIEFGWSLKSEGILVEFSKQRSLILEDDIITDMQIVKTDLSLLKNILKDASDVVIINLRVVRDQQFELHDSLLSSLKCAICKCYLKAIIYMCPKGDNFCASCCFKIRKCPLCEASIGNTRNHALEAISNTVHYPCSYSDFGCKKKLVCAQMKNHENECIFKVYDCPFKNDTGCSWKNTLPFLSTHLEESKHSEFICSSYIQVINKVSVNYSYNNSKAYYRKFIMKAFDEIFCVHYKQENTKHDYWAVQIVRSGREHRKYKYEVILPNLKNNNHKVIITDFCNNFSDTIQYVLFPNSLLSELSVKDTFAFSYKHYNDTKYYIRVSHVD